MDIGNKMLNPTKQKLKQIGVKLPVELYKKAKKYKEQKGVSIEKQFEQALNAFYKKNLGE